MVADLTFFVALTVALIPNPHLLPELRYRPMTLKIENNQMKKYSEEQALADIGALKTQDKIMRKLKLDPFCELEQYATQIQKLAACKGGSKRNIQRILKAKHNFEISADRIYRYVKSKNGGVWPNCRTKK